MSTAAAPAPDPAPAADPAGAQPRPESCPLCGTPLRPGQEWCLNCGAAARTRLAAAPSWRGPLLALLIVAVLALGVLAAALVKLAGDSGPAPAPRTTTVTGPAAPATNPATTVPGSVSTPTTATTAPATGATSTPGAAPGTTTPNAKGTPSK